VLEQILWKTDCKQAQHRQQSKIAPQQWMVSPNCARVHDFELRLSHGNRRFDSKRHNHIVDTAGNNLFVPSMQSKTETGK
jgi:hypothetical protein